MTYAKKKLEELLIDAKRKLDNLYIAKEDYENDIKITIRDIEQASIAVKEIEQALIKLKEEV